MMPDWDGAEQMCAPGSIGGMRCWMARFATGDLEFPIIGKRSRCPDGAKHQGRGVNLFAQEDTKNFKEIRSVCGRGRRERET